MGTFIADGAAALPDVKTDARAPTGAATEWAAQDANEVRTALLDLRTAAISGTPYDAIQDANMVASVAAEATVRAAADAAIIASGAEPANVGLAPVIAGATGATTPRTVAAHFGDTINLKDAGCVCDGVTNDYAALAALVTALGTTAKTIVVSGDCHVHSDITLPWRCPVRFEGGGKFSGTGKVTFFSVSTLPNDYSAPRAPMLTQMYGDPSSVNDVWRMAYNQDMSTGAAYSADHPQWSENFEARYIDIAPPNGWIERHWNYKSIDGTVSYRPFNFGLDLNNHRADMQWNIHKMEFYSRAGTNPVMRITTDEVSGAVEGILIQAPTSGNPLQLVGGPGNISFQLNADQGFFLSSELDAASAGTPNKNSVALFLRGSYWNGASSVNANLTLQLVMQGASNADAVLNVRGAEYRFSQAGGIEMPGGLGEGIKMSSPSGARWKLSISDAGAVVVAAA